MVASPNDESKDTAQSHTPPATDAAPGPGPVADAAEPPADPASAPANGDGDQLDLALLKKKKKAKKAEAEAEAEAEDGDAADAGGDEGDAAIDLTLKKKKKKKVPKDDAGDDFAKKLEALNIEGEDGDYTNDAGASGDAAGEQDGDMDKGTGIWSHDETKTINYTPLLARFYAQLAERHPDHASSAARSYKIPPPQCMREGNKKTIIANLAEICKRMNRSDEHVTAFLFAELGTTGSTDGNRRLVIKGKFQQKQIESVLRTYIMEYVSCRTCRSPSTALSKGENRLYFVTCNSCNSRRTVQAIKTGFAAQVGKRRKMLK